MIADIVDLERYPLDGAREECRETGGDFEYSPLVREPGDEHHDDVRRRPPRPLGSGQAEQMYYGRTA